MIAILIGPIVFAHGTLNAAATLHHNLLSGILLGTQKFFDTIPMGRILARFSSDLYVLDSVLPMKMKQVIIFFFRVGCRPSGKSNNHCCLVFFFKLDFFILLCVRSSFCLHAIPVFTCCKECDGPNEIDLDVA